MLIGIVGAAMANHAEAGIQYPECDGVGYNENWNIPAVASAGNKIIYVNPRHFRFRRDTIVWLILRQCALEGGEHRLNDRFNEFRSGAEKADCWAILQMKNKRLLSSYSLRDIEYDLKRMNNEDWRVNLGRFRQIDLYNCLR